MPRVIRQLKWVPWAAAMADMLATSTEAEEETPLPSGTAEETYSTIKNLFLIRYHLWFINFTT